MYRALRRLFDKEAVVSLSEADLCIDVAELHPNDLARAGFLTRARKWSEIIPEEAESEEVMTLPEMQIEGWGRKVEGCHFAPRATHSCVIYDKILEIKQHSPDKVWFLDLWRVVDGMDAHRSPVLRCATPATSCGRSGCSITMICWTGWVICGATAPRSGCATVCPRPMSTGHAGRCIRCGCSFSRPISDVPSCPVVRQKQQRVVLERMVAAVTGLCHLDSRLDRRTDGKRRSDVLAGVPVVL